MQVLLLNGSDSVTVSNNGNFVISTALESGTQYNVAIGSQPAGQTCTVVNGAGTVDNANVSNVAVSCSVNTYSLGGSVSGLTSGQVQLTDGTDTVTVSANGGFTFPTALAAGTRYGVSVSAQPTAQICTIANASGTLSDNVSNVAVTCAPAPGTYSLGGTVSGLVSGTQFQLSDGTDTATISGNGPFTFATHLTVGAAYTVALSGPQPTGQTCAISNGSGTMASANVSSVAVSCTRNEYAYVANATDSTVGQYTTGTDGALTPMSTPTVAAGSKPYAIAVDPSGKYAYVANYGNGNNTVFQYTIGTDGALTPMSPPTVAAGNYSFGVAVDPSGKYAYVANAIWGAGTVSQYTIGTDGALTPMSTPTVATGSNAYSVAVDPTGKYAYVASFNGNKVAQYTIGPGGALTPMSTPTVATASYATFVTVDPSGKYAYVANSNGNTISQFTIGTGGALTPMSTATVAASGPWSIAVDPTGKYAYVANNTGNTVGQYTIGTDGALTPMSTPTVASDVSPYSVTVDPSGKYVYAANSTGKTVSQYTIGTGGALTRIGSQTAGTNARFVITTYARTQ